MSVFTLVCCSLLVHRHLTGHARKGAAEQVHSRSEGGGGQRHQEVPTLCGPGVRHPQCGDGLIQEEKVRTCCQSLLLEKY